ncbi:hypothetical protein [Sphingopyxis yananensis]|uniref:hypothetical protein n=1 Tax=Sphingopyxis yananensis TaxID=2886687 RepID=UPI001D12D26A|nr:hypothetical protein [Sphingopyxis yananensis]MCC2601097.1 hypothetical protein [Sphingopyxis yananensis]
MTGDGIVQTIWFIGAFTLVISALVARRLPIGDVLKMALIWIAIFAVMFAVASWWQGLG